MNTMPMPAVNPREYSFQRGEWIALQYSMGDCTLVQLHNSHPELVPEPFYIKRWRRDYPAFDILMTEAEQVRAQVYFDELVEVAEGGDTAADRRNMMVARTTIAERYDRARFARTPPAAPGQDAGKGNVTNILAVNLSDEQLMAIASGHALDDEGKVIEGERGTLEKGGEGPAAFHGAPGYSLLSDPNTPDIDPE